MPCRNSVLGLNQRGCPLGIHRDAKASSVCGKSIASQRLLVNLVTTYDADFDSEAFVGQLRELLGDRIQGVCIPSMTTRRTGRGPSRREPCIFGDPYVTETLHGLDLMSNGELFKPIRQRRGCIR